jgi:hypothetical protein
MRDEYKQLRKSEAGESGVRAWARKHKLEIVSLKGYDILVIPEQAPVNEPPAVSKCDARKCPVADLTYGVKNYGGKIVGMQWQTCTAGSCKLVRDPVTGGWKRNCGDWKCKDVGSLVRI